jgi:hypothetical protein
MAADRLDEPPRSFAAADRDSSALTLVSPPFDSLPSRSCASGCACRVCRKLVFRKYDPVVKKHVLFEESKMR